MALRYQKCRSAALSLARFITAVGPRQYIGEEKLSWWEFGKIALYVGRRMAITRLRGPRYIFAGTVPSRVIRAALKRLVDHDVQMPIQKIIPLELASIVNGVRLLCTHRTKGRIVIDFARTQHR